MSSPLDYRFYSGSDLEEPAKARQTQTQILEQIQKQSETQNQNENQDQTQNENQNGGQNQTQQQQGQIDPQMAAMMKTMSQVLANDLSQAFQNLQNQNNPSSSNSSFRPPRLESDHDGDPKNQPPTEWLQKAEMQFRAHNSPESRWVVSAVPFLSGLAFTWYLNNFQNTEIEHNWAAFKAGLQQAYIGADPQVRGMQIITSMSLQKSKYNVAQYIARFQKAVTEMGSEAPTEKFQCYLFHNGLNL